jgi:uncharacterized membrane protein YfcA
MSVYFILIVTAFLAGGINAVAGGGTLLTFPALVAALGGDAAANVLANGTSTVALVPGAIAAAWAYRQDLGSSTKILSWLLPLCVVGGAIGAMLVVWLPSESFQRSVPWLILLAATLFAVQPRISAWSQKPRTSGTHTLAINALVMCCQFAVAIYGGYFGAGIGILMLAALSLLGLTDIHQMNGVKSILGGTINLVASAMFIWQANVEWRYALVMAFSATLGGFAGVRFAKRFSRDRVRQFIVMFGFALAAYYLWKKFR